MPSFSSRRAGLSSSSWGTRSSPGNQASQSRGRWSKMHSARSRQRHEPYTDSFSSRTGNSHFSQAPSRVHAISPSTSIHGSPCDLQEGEGTELEDDESDMFHETIMAINMLNNNTVGCAYYVAIDEKMLLEEDIPMGGIELVETLIFHMQPTTVIVSSRAPDPLIDILQKGIQDPNGSKTDGVSGPYIVRTVNKVEFSPSAGKDKIVNLDLDIFQYEKLRLLDVTEDAMDAGGGSIRNRYMRLGTIINFDSSVSIGCAGAVLNELQRRKSSEYLPHDPNALFRFHVKSVEMFTLTGFMFLNADSLASLQIMGSESHPNSQMQGPHRSNAGSKEGLSVYGLVQGFASTPQGKSSLRRMFLRPSVNIDVIRERQKTLHVLLRPENDQVFQSIAKFLKKIKNVKATLTHLHKGIDQSSLNKPVYSGAWTTLRLFARYALELQAAVLTLTGAADLVIISKIREQIVRRDIQQVGERLSRVIDFEQSKDEGRTIVLRGVDEELDRRKDRFDETGRIRHDAFRNVLEEIPNWAHRFMIACEYVPQTGFLLWVTLNRETGRGCYSGSDLPDDRWDTVFTKGDLIAYKNRLMRELDQMHGDPFWDMVDREIAVVHEVKDYILEREETLLAASDIYGEFDSLCALARAAHKYEWTAPEITGANVYQIHGGRHPLQELVVPAFIPNDCKLAGGPGQDGGDGAAAGMTSTMVLTGPNHSGKSVYLKQVALIVYLAHIGSYVPADSAVIGLTDRILTRISTRESVSRNESAFSIDLRQALFSMNFATRRSLVLLDEFGKGTNPANGAGLVAALLDHFNTRGDNRPKVLAASHFHEIFEGSSTKMSTGVIQESENLMFANMEVRVDRGRDVEDVDVAYLFKLVPGLCISSYGAKCAQMNGVPGNVISRADVITDLLVRHEDLRAACAELSETEKKRLLGAEAVCRRFLAQDFALLGQGAERGVKTMRSMLEEMLEAMVETEQSSVRDGNI